jgi:hypothetical protein
MIGFFHAVAALLYGFYSDIWIAGIFEIILCSFCAERAVKGRHRQGAAWGENFSIPRWF